MNEPRTHLYIFAHRAMPILGLGHPKQMLGTLLGPQCGEFLKQVWADAGAELKAGERMEYPDLVCSVRKRRPYLMALIEFPQPMGMTEPYFSAFVFGPFQEQDPMLEVNVRYIVLEHGTTDEGGVRTVLCEWNQKQHVNFGDGPQPHVEDFEEAAFALVQQKQDQE